MERSIEFLRSRFPGKLIPMSRDEILEPARPMVDLRIDYARELNEQQHAAVTAPPGPALVLAGAGAGKTRTLIYRVAYLLEQGIPMERVLLLTFTNKAAREMMNRVQELLGGDFAALWGGTFHSIGNRILRRHADRVGFKNNFTILDREDTRSFLKSCLTELEPEEDRSKPILPKADELMDILSQAANARLGVGEWIEQRREDIAHLVPRIEALARHFQERKRAANLMDFDDLLSLWLRLLLEHTEVREQFQRRFQFVLVDEYQDTNTIQADLIDLLAARHKNLMVVGDDSQSIYSWRGANFLNILHFPRRYPDARIFKIETNYRSTPEILQVANAAIQANVHQFQKELAAARRPGMKPVLIRCTSADQQADFVASRLEQCHEEGTALEKMAVLYRSHFHSLELQLALRSRGIPFSVTSGVPFFEQAHIKDVTAYLKLICNPADELAFKRVIQMLPGVGPKAASKLWFEYVSAARGSGLLSEPEPAPSTPNPAAQGVSESAPKSPKPDARRNPDESAAAQASLLATTLQACQGVVPKKAAIAWAEMVITFSQLDTTALRQRPAAMIDLLIEAAYEDYALETFSNADARLDDLQGLVAFAAKYNSLEAMLSQLALLSSIEEESDRPAERDKAKVRLTTIHQAKGLEFDVVFLIMLCDGMFPSYRSIEVPESLEEERRLFYVAITRARDALFLCYPSTRATPDGGSLYKQSSRFLSEIPRALIEVVSLAPTSSHWHPKPANSTELWDED